MQEDVQAPAAITRCTLDLEVITKSGSKTSDSATAPARLFGGFIIPDPPLLEAVAGYCGCVRQIQVVRRFFRTLVTCDGSQLGIAAVREVSGRGWRLVSPSTPSDVAAAVDRPASLA